MKGRKMRNQTWKFCTAMMLAAFLAAGAVSAAPYTILDDYIGGNPTHASYNGYDVIGVDSVFNLTKMEVEVGNGKLQVKIYGNYFDDIVNNSAGLYGTQMGDLFISTNGYTPYTPSASDTYLTGEQWEYAIALDSHQAMSGNASLHAISDGDIKLSFVNGGIYRADQEVQFVPKSINAAKATGKWEIGQNLDFLAIEILLPGEWAGYDSLGFHWAMTCANDVIEGGTPVPEPATMCLLGIGLIGLGGYGRRKLFKK